MRHIDDFIADLIYAWGEWRDAQLDDSTKELVDDVFAAELDKLEQLAIILG